MKAIANLITIVALVASANPAALALESHERSGWYAGLGFGPARAALQARDGDSWIWDTGSSPQIRGGKLLGQHFGLGLEAQTWFTEFGTAGDDLPLQLKIRMTGHLWALAGTWYPGSPESAWGGFFVRAGAGPAIANYAAAIPNPQDPEGGEEIQVRIDEWGWGLVAAVGYELRVTRQFVAGLQVSSNHLWIDREILRVWYGGPVLHFLWYF